VLILNKTQGKFLHSIINQWVENQTIPPETGELLRQGFSIRPFDWKKLAKYSFWVSLICFVIAAGSLLADKVLLEWLEAFFTLSDALRSFGLAVLSALVFYFGLSRRRAKPKRVFSNEAIFFLGVLLCAGSIVFLGMAIDTGSGHFSLLFLLATLVYGILGLTLSSKLIWVFAILSLGSWFGMETGYISGWGAYYLGMNFPLRFVLFGAVLTALSFGFGKLRQLKGFQKPTYVLGLLYLFIALWLLSIFGNHGDDRWLNIRQIELLHWGLLFALAAIAAIFYGLKYDDSTSRAFGITFLFINLYTKYFEFFWDNLHKAIFFMVMAASFWLLGSRAEKIWNLEFLKRPSPKRGGDSDSDTD